MISKNCESCKPLKIEFYRKDSFGNIHYYIKSKTKANEIELLLRKKTIGKGEMSVIQRLFDVQFIQVLAPEEETPL